MVAEKKVVELWGIDWGMEIEREWKKETPTLYRGEAVEGPKAYTATGGLIAVEDTYAAKNAFCYRSRIWAAERVRMGVGLTKKEAIDLAFAAEVAKKDAALKALKRAERRMAELMMLELRVEKGEP